MSAIVLVLILGPLGLLYANVLWSLLISVLTIVLSAIATPVIGLPAGWVFSVLLGLIMPAIHNRKMKNMAKVVMG